MAKAAVRAKRSGKRDSAASRERILEAATREFAEKGYDGARVDEIADASGFNKNALYHYFGSKEKLFVAVLERAYATIRDRQSDLSIRDMDPEEGMRRLVEFTARVWVEMPEFNRLLASENLHEARHVRQSTEIPKMYNPLLETIRELLKRGVETGRFRDDIDAIDLYISISALSAHYISHRHTFEAIFQTKLLSPKRLQQRIDHAADMIVSYLRKEPG
ncbi:TetR family transcriptional regulator [Marivibrio halodurans]|uniref:TetR family transcriptional regulator n=1 Tax=Marivibrio halodurans TaxID=2039722 RepID=A0A8J7S836_9PROT|nr:TetR/AcrR family transcriptional regulator [Marivibrio halodurans]MBP5858579.1 TetR family transcriptional regulator [Marivibrio halodurans]